MRVKITLESICTGTIEKFADAYELEMHVRERKLPIGDPCRYFAAFRGVEEKQGSCLVSTHGNGATPEEAIRDYARQLSMKPIVHNAMCDDRRDIETWRFTEAES